MANKTIKTRIEWVTDTFKIIGEVRDNVLIEVDIISLKNVGGRGNNSLSIKTPDTVLARSTLSTEKETFISVLPQLRELAEQLHIIIEDLKNDAIV